MQMSPPKVTEVSYPEGIEGKITPSNVKETTYSEGQFFLMRNQRTFFTMEMFLTISSVDNILKVEISILDNQGNL